MRTKQPFKTLSRSLLLLGALVLSACVTVQDGPKCAAQGLVLNGGMCAHLVSTAPAYTISATELLDLLNAQPADRTCVPAGQVVAPDGKTITEPGIQACADDQTHGILELLKARGASVILDDATFVQLTDELQEACRELGASCSYATMQMIKTMSKKIAQ